MLAKVLFTLVALTTDRHCTLNTPNLEAFIERTQMISAAEKSGKKFWTNPTTMPIRVGCSIDVGLGNPSRKIRYKTYNTYTRCNFKNHRPKKIKIFACYYEAIEIPVVCKIVGLFWPSSIDVTDSIFNDTHTSLKSRYSCSMNHRRETVTTIPRFKKLGILLTASSISNLNYR